MEQINILEARNNLSRLVKAVGNGSEVVIANRGKPVARLVPVEVDAPKHTAAQAASWLTRNLVPSHSAREENALDQQIAFEREGWE